MDNAKRYSLSPSNILRIIASLKLSLVVLILLCVLMALAAWLEKLHGTTFAQWTIYDSPFFFALFVLLFMNILTSALFRLPFRKKLTGFYIIHLGILVLLLGMLISRFWGYEGSIELTPHEPITTFTTTDPTLTVCFLNTQDDNVIQIKRPLPKKIYGFKASDKDILGFKSSERHQINLDGHLIGISDFIPFADPQNIQTIRLPQSDNDHRVMSAHIEMTPLTWTGPSDEAWITNAHPVHLTLSETEMCVVVLGQDERELPFSLTLNKFEVGTDPDSATPSSYTSWVTITDNDGQHDAMISMNKPLNVQGFRFFQSSYFDLDDGTLGSILIVNKGPGRLTKYLGSGLLVFGSCIHLFLRKKP